MAKKITLEDRLRIEAKTAPLERIRLLQSLLDSAVFFRGLADLPTTRGPGRPRGKRQPVLTKAQAEAQI